MFSCEIRLDNNNLLSRRVPFDIENGHHKALILLTKFTFNHWHFKACLYTFLFKRCPKEGYYISQRSLWENYQPLLTSSMSHPHAGSCETLDCLTKPQDRETIDYRFSSLSPAFKTYNICAPKSDSSPQTLHPVSAIMCIPACMWCHWPSISTLPLPTCCVSVCVCVCARAPLFVS